MMRALVDVVMKTVNKGIPYVQEVTGDFSTSNCESKVFDGLLHLA